MTAYSVQRLLDRHREKPDTWPTTPVGAGAANTYEDHEARMLKWFGFRPRAGHLRHYPCPRTIVGKRCRAHTAPDGLCICQKHHRILDHSRGWVDQHGAFVHTAEPYSFSGRELADLVGDLADIGVEAEVSGESLWYPTSTVMLVLRKLPEAAR